jgi:hypothetical protein
MICSNSNTRRSFVVAKSSHTHGSWALVVFSQLVSDSNFHFIYLCRLISKITGTKMNTEKREHWTSEISDMEIMSPTFNCSIHGFPAWCSNNSSPKEAEKREVETYARKCVHRRQGRRKSQRRFHVACWLVFSAPSSCVYLVCCPPRPSSPESPIIIVIIYYTKVRRRRKNIINYDLRFPWFFPFFNSMSDEIRNIK